MKSFEPKGPITALFRRQQRALRRVASQSNPGALTAVTTKGVTKRPLPQRSRGTTSGRDTWAA